MITFVSHARFRNIGKLKEDIIKNNKFYSKCSIKDFVIKIIETTMVDVDKAKGHNYGKLTFPVDKIIEKVDQFYGTPIYRYIIPVESEYDMPFSALTTKTGFWSEFNPHDEGTSLLLGEEVYHNEELSDLDVSYLMNMAWEFLNELDWYELEK